MYSIFTTKKDYVKEAYYFLINYLKIRMNYIDSMKFEEVCLLINITSKTYLFYQSITNDQSVNVQLNNLPLIEEHDILYITKYIFPEFTGFHTTCPMKINSNFFIYKCLLEILQVMHYDEIIIEYFKKNTDIVLQYPFDSVCFIINNFREHIDLYKDCIASSRLKQIISIENTYFNIAIKSLTINKELKMSIIPNFSFSQTIFQSDFCIIVPIYNNEIHNNEMYSLNEDIEEFFIKDLKFFSSFLSLSSLEKKLFGINELSNICNKLITLSSPQQPQYFLNNGGSFFLKQKIKSTIEYFKKSQIIQQIYEENVHEAIISKSAQLFKFLYKNGLINIEQLYVSSHDKHQSIKESVLFIFSQSMDIFSKEHMDFIIKIITEGIEMSENVLKLIENFHINPYITNKQKKIFLNLFMKFSNENGSYKMSLITKARSTLANILIQMKEGKYLTKVLKKCIDDIAWNKNMNTNCNLIMLILSRLKNVNLSEFKFDASCNDYSQFLKYLNDKFTIKSSILNGMLDLKREMLFFCNEILKSQSSSNVIQDYEMNENEIMNNYEKKANINIISSNAHNQVIANQGMLNNEIEITSNANLNMTQSTEKSLDDIDDDFDQINNNNNHNHNNEENESNSSSHIEIDSISTDISALEKNKKQIIQNFIQSYCKELQTNEVTFTTNFNFIFKKIKLNNNFNNNYYDLTLMLLNLLKILILNSLISLTKKEIEFLFIILVDNAIDIEESNLFFNFFSEILKYQYLSKVNYLSEDVIVYLFFDILSKLNMQTLPVQAFELFKNFFILINSSHNNLIINNNSGKIIKINNFSLLVCFEKLWLFYLCTNNKFISNEALTLIMNILNAIIEGNDSENISKIIDKIFKEISDKQHDQTCLIRLINLFYILNCKVNNISIKNNEMKVLIQESPVKLKVKNNYFSNNGEDAMIDVLPSDDISKVKELIINNIICKDKDDSTKAIVHSTGIILNCKGKTLVDKMKIRDYKIQSGALIIVFKDEPTFNINKEETIDEDLLHVKIEEVKVVFPQLNEGILKLALKKNNYNIEETVMYLTDEEHLLILEHELSSLNNQMAQPSKENEMDTQFNLLLNEQRLTQLIELLNHHKNNKELHESIWKMLSSIVYPKSLIIKILEIPFETLFLQENESPLLIMQLKLINSIIFKQNDFGINISIENNISNIWIQNLLKPPNFSYFIKAINKDETNPFTSQLIISWIYLILNQSLTMLNSNGQQVQMNNDRGNAVFDTSQLKQFWFNIIENKIHLNLISLLNLKQIPSQIEKLYSILLLIFTENKNAINDIIENELKQKTILNLLLNSNYFEIRHKSLEFLKFMVIQSNSDLITYILNHYNLITDQNIPIPSEEFFDLFSFVLTNKQNITINIDHTQFIAFIINRILLTSNTKDTNMSLIGYINLLQALCISHSDTVLSILNENNKYTQLINLICNSLFTLNSLNLEFPFSNKRLRKISYSLLINLMKISTQYKNDIYQNIIQYHNMYTPNPIELTEIDIPIRNQNDMFIGLRNYGATCYLNSLFQQLFQMPSFNKTIFAFKKENDDSFTQSTIYQYQLAYANMLYTMKKYFPPINLIHSIKSSFDSQPINVHIQQDSDEFLAILTDELEKEAKTFFNKEDFLNESFKGIICNEMFSLEEEFPHYSSRDESFIRITLDIKNHKTLESALDAFVSDEVLEGDNKYFVEKYNRKISIRKRAMIKTLGKTVIIHLKRFEFDYTTFNDIKLNDYIKFPLEIDFKKWIKESSLNEKNSHYILTGIIVHSGSTLRSGHYYSFIMEQKTKKWRRFDDTKVCDFDIKDIERECYGEDKENKMGNEYDFMMKCANAYLLIYTRIDEFNDTNQEEIVIDNKIKETIAMDNFRFVNLKNFADDDYKSFIKEVNNIYNPITLQNQMVIKDDVE